MSLFDPLVNQLQSLASAGTAVPTQIEVLEGELAWLVYIVGAVVGARGTSRSSEEHELLDGDLCAKVFQVLFMSPPCGQYCAQWWKLVCAACF
jgi:exportin-7